MIRHAFVSLQNGNVMPSIPVRKADMEMEVTSDIPQGLFPTCTSITVVYRLDLDCCTCIHHDQGYKLRLEYRSFRPSVWYLFSFSLSILLPEDCYLNETWSCNKCFEVHRNHYECQPLCQRQGHTYDIVRKTRSTDLCKSYRK